VTCSSCSCVADAPFDLLSELDAFTKHVFLHQALLKDDMIEIFSDPCMINVNLDVTVTGNDGNPEEGTGVGVMREVLTSFWQLVYHSLTVGTQEKVPCIRHDLQLFGEGSIPSSFLLPGFTHVTNSLATVTIRHLGVLQA